MRLCIKCKAAVPIGKGRCSCGGEVGEWLRAAPTEPEPDRTSVGPNESDPNADPELRARDVGAALGAVLTGGSRLGTAVGHHVGKKLEGVQVVSFAPADPQDDVAIEVVPPISKVRDFFGKAALKVAEKFRRKPRSKT